MEKGVYIDDNRTYLLDAVVEKGSSVIPLAKGRNVRTKDLIENIRRLVDPSSEILPDGCKAFKTLSNGSKIIVVEEPPKVRSIFVDEDPGPAIEVLKQTGRLTKDGERKFYELNPESPYQYQLSFPYVVFLIGMTHDNQEVVTYPYFRLQPITSYSDYLIRAPLYNIPNGQDICLGTKSSSRNVNGVVDGIKENFWTRVFNRDYTINVSAYKDVFEVSSHLTWMFNTLIDPMFIYDIKWLMDDRTIHDVMGAIEDRLKDYNRVRPGFDIIIDSVKHVKSASSRTPSTSVNTVESHEIDDRIVSLGDEVIFDGKPYYVYSFVGEPGDVPEVVELEDENGDITEVDLYTSKHLIKVPSNEKILESIEVNDFTLKSNDIIEVKEPFKSFKRVKGIRISRDNQIEVKMGRFWYLIENIDVEKFDTENITFNGVRIKVDELIEFVNTSDRNGRHSLYNPQLITKRMKFYDCDFSRSNELRFVFKDNNDYTVTIDPNDDTWKIVTTENYITPESLLIGNRIFINKPDPVDALKPSFHVVPDYGIINNLKGEIDFEHYCSSSEDIILSCFDADMTNFSIMTIEGKRIEYKVGDPIIYFDWENPTNILMISVIEKFERRGDSVYVISKSINKLHEFTIPLIDLNSNTFNVGIIRKVVARYGEWSSGDKLRANVPRLTNFPKKDVNAIIAIIADGFTKYPLALCSNLCTLWMNEETINKFDVYKRNDPKWKTKIAKFDVNKIKIQYGDIFRGRSSSQLKLVIGIEQNELKVASNRGSEISRQWIYKHNLENYNRHGVLLPRYPITNNRAMSNEAVPNFMGGYYAVGNMGLWCRCESFRGGF